MYRTDLWTLWEKVRVGWSERTASKHVYYQVWNRSPAQVGCMRQVLRPGALGRPRGIRWRGRWEEGSGWGIHVYPRLIHVNVRQKLLQYCKVISLQLTNKNKNKEEITGWRYIYKKKKSIQFHLSVQLSLSVVSSSLWSHEPQHVMLPCPSPTPRACSNSCPFSQWCHPTISSSVIPFSSCLQSFPSSRSFPMSQFFTSGTLPKYWSFRFSISPSNEHSGLISIRISKSSIFGYIEYWL